MSTRMYKVCYLKLAVNGNGPINLVIVSVKLLKSLINAAEIYLSACILGFQNVFIKLLLSAGHSGARLWS